MAMSDIIVIRAEGAEFSVDRNLITKHSRYFDSLLNQPWKEHNIQEINLSDATPSEFQWLYEAIKICEVGRENVIREYFQDLDAEKLIGVYQAALYYNFPDIISHLCTTSVPSIVNPANVVRLWHYFTVHYETKIVNFLYEYLKENFSKVLNCDELDLTEDETAKFLTAEQIGVDSETHLSAGIAKHFGKSPLLNLVNFATLPIEVMLDVVDKLDEARRSAVLKSFFSRSVPSEIYPHLQTTSAYCRLGFTDAIDLTRICHTDLERLDFSNSAGNSHKLDILHPYTNLKALDFTNCKLKFEKFDRSMVNLFPFMEELKFDNYTGKSLQAIPWLLDAGTLRKFSARNSPNLETISNIGLCSNLEKLDLRNCNNVSLKEIPKYLKLPNLEYLDVSGTRIAEDDDNILFRGNIRNLTYLAMNDIATVDRALVMTVFRYMTRLESLEMNRLVTYTTISPDKDTTYLTNLKRLSCRDTLITTLFLEYIWKNCKYLQHLDIRGCKHIAMDTLCEIFAKFPRDLLTFKAGWGLRNNSMNSLKPSLLNLERLHLSAGSTVSPDLEFIQTTKLKQFSLSFCSISPQSIERIVTQNTSLEKIQLEMNFSCEPIYSTVLQNIKNCKNLTKLSLKGIHFEDDENYLLKQIAENCKHLKSLKIFNNNKLKLSSLLSLRRLQQIDFEECYSFTYEDFKALIASNMLLKSITVVHCFKFDREIFVQAHDKLPQLMYLTLDHCDMTEDGLMHPYHTDKSCMRMLKIHRCKKKRAMHLTSLLPGKPVIDYFM